MKSNLFHSRDFAQVGQQPPGCLFQGWMEQVRVNFTERHQDKGSLVMIRGPQQKVSFLPSAFSSFLRHPSNSSGASFVSTLITQLIKKSCSTYPTGSVLYREDRPRIRFSVHASSLMMAASQLAILSPTLEPIPIMAVFLPLETTNKGPRPQQV
jgi:hypothetical protein